MFSLATVFIALRWCHLQVENMDQIITMVKNWLDDMGANCKPKSNLKQYLKMEEFLVEDNNELIQEHNFFEELKSDSD